MPPYGKVIYVRDYGKDDLSDTDASGNKRDGSSWATAINGNCTSYTNNHGFISFDSEPYAEDASLTGLQWAVDHAFYLSTVQEDGTIGYNKQSVQVAENGLVGNVEKKHAKVISDKRVQVWVGAGDYLRADGFFMRDGVDVYGGFPNTGNPGMKERNPKLESNYTNIMTNSDETVSSETSFYGSESYYGPLIGTGSFSTNSSQSNIVDNTLGNWYSGLTAIECSSFHSDGVNGEGTGDGQTTMDKAVDGNASHSNSTFWHTSWKDPAPPHHIVIDLGEEKMVGELALWVYQG